MFFAFLLFVLYFAVGMFVVICLWAAKIRFGSVEGLDPESFLVRLLRRKPNYKADVVEETITRSPARRLFPPVSSTVAKQEVFDRGRVVELQVREQEIIKSKVLADVLKTFEKAREHKRRAVGLLPESNPVSPGGRSKLAIH